MNDPLPPVLYERHDDGVAVITLNRPEKKNAINLDMARLIQTYLQRAEQDDAIRAIVLTGHPEVFSAGMDVKAFRQGSCQWSSLRGLAASCMPNSPRSS
ncbi:4-chlorobenzoyl coenzyme A dehalogenase-2 [Serratia plymuthica]|uniref:4-chlorobenzoyl coenzyme A dehalogenase-2 n=1 Tax=Serratia plymuthica TaxID=82996 RepID=A0A2X4UCC3_SERPL|nr:4-chlorobenzoyl coenzyme A dehalogenase-2 [Serratia plymuthica]